MSETDNPSEKLKGVVKWFNDAKGFGFIEHGSGRDVFVHYSVIEQDGFKTLEDGEEVEYEVKEGPKGLHAVRVHRVNIKIVLPSDAVQSDALPAEAMQAAQTPGQDAASSADATSQTSDA